MPLDIFQCEPSRVRKSPQVGLVQLPFANRAALRTVRQHSRAWRHWMGRSGLSHDTQDTHGYTLSNHSRRAEANPAPLKSSPSCTSALTHLALVMVVNVFGSTATVLPSWSVAP